MLPGGLECEVAGPWGEKEPLGKVWGRHNPEEVLGWPPVEGVVEELGECVETNPEEAEERYEGKVRRGHKEKGTDEGEGEDGEHDGPRRRDEGVLLFQPARNLSLQADGMSEFRATGQLSLCRQPEGVQEEREREEKSPFTGRERQEGERSRTAWSVCIL